MLILPDFVAKYTKFLHTVNAEISSLCNIFGVMARFNSKAVRADEKVLESASVSAITETFWCLLRFNGFNAANLEETDLEALLMINASHSKHGFE